MVTGQYNMGKKIPLRGVSIPHIINFMNKVNNREAFDRFVRYLALTLDRTVTKDEAAKSMGYAAAKSVRVGTASMDRYVAAARAYDVNPIEALTYIGLIESHEVPAVDEDEPPPPKGSPIKRPRP